MAFGDLDHYPPKAEVGNSKNKVASSGVMAVGAHDLVQDLAAANVCFERLGERRAMILLGELLRLHHPHDYTAYLRPAAEKAAAEKAAAEKVAAETAERAAAAKAVADKNVAEKAAADKVAVERNVAEKAAADKVAVEKAVAEKTAAEKAATEKAAAEATERAAAENVAAEKAVAEKAVADKAAGEKAAEEEAAAEKAATEEAAAGKAEASTETRIVLKERSSARLTRWDVQDDEDSGDEAIGTISSLARAFSLLGSAVSIGFSMVLSSDPSAAGKQIAAMCRKQGGIYIKAAQSISSMAFAFPDDVLEEFASLQDNADPQPWHEIEPRVEKHTPGGVDFIYDSFGQDAMNAASIAQVHSAKRRTGEDVIAKVLRRSINQTFNQDVTNYLSMLSMYEKATGIQVQWMQEWVMEELKNEIDFRNEADLHEWAGEFLRKHRQHFHLKLCVPELHAELCTKRILVMERIDGCKITKGPEYFSDWDRERDVPQLFDVLENWLAMQIFLTGKFHGDPHPGNVLLRRKKHSVPKTETPYEIVVIDHGGYFELSPRVRQLYAELWCMMEKPVNDAQRLKRKARATEIMDEWGVGHYVRYILEQVLDGHMGTADPLSDIPENGLARMHRYNKMAQNGKESGPEMFFDVKKMSPELMKAQGSAKFLHGVFRKLMGKMKGWNLPEKSRAIMIKWAKQSPGVTLPR